MGQRNLKQFSWVIAATAGLAGASIACSKEEPPAASPATIGGAQVFRFAPPDGSAPLPRLSLKFDPTRPPPAA